MLGSIIGPAIGAIGSIFGGRKTTKSSVDYVAMRKNAEKAGFNPLTALQNGGSAGFARVSGPPALSSTEAIANVLGTAADTWFNRDKVAADAEKEALEVALMRQELANLQKPSEVVRQRDFGYSIPQVTLRTGVSHGSVSSPALAASVAPAPVRAAASGSSASGRQPIGGAPALTAFGVDWTGSGRFSNADTIEQEAGDLVGEPLSVMGGLDAFGHTIGQMIQPYADRFMMRRLYKAVKGNQRPKPLPPLASDVAPPRQDEWFKNVPTYQ